MNINNDGIFASSVRAPDSRISSQTAAGNCFLSAILRIWWEGLLFRTIYVNNERKKKHKFKYITILNLYISNSAPYSHCCTIEDIRNNNNTFSNNFENMLPYLDHCSWGQKPIEFVKFGNMLKNLKPFEPENWKWTNNCRNFQIKCYSTSIFQVPLQR